MTAPAVAPDALAALHAACFRRPRPWSEAEFAALLAMPGAMLLVEPGPGGGALAGFLLGRIAGGEAEVLTLAVHPKARRRGLGARLVARFLAAAADRGAGRAFLEVATDNSAARALYARAGFAEAGLRRGYLGPGHDALVLARDLGGI